MSEEHDSAIDLPEASETDELPALLPGEFRQPEGARALIILAHAGAETAVEEQALADALHEIGLATLVIDLLHDDEERFADPKFNTPQLTGRLLDLMDLIRRRVSEGQLPDWPIGLYATDHVAPAAVRVAAQRDAEVLALVCCGGLIDLAGLMYLQALRAPLLLLVEDDAHVRELAQRALAHIDAPSHWHAIAGVDSPPHSAITQAEIGALGIDWFSRHLPSSPRHGK
ncbi:hypothetical protein HCX48_01705 [Rhodocyclus tenuis]|uniref:Alpha/beta hydrolase n=1 Tax=Rhodocyclus gracilis TaxID=2929842 RepID=A0ABX0WDY2_9RHOO|nr:hypothetical protein [Rhodocyclus gracilis]NJA87941.1 hypothetical protein [Rhodocyclus gracilis]